MKEFAPPGHRCETVRTLDGVLWLNDSKATNLHALETALKSQHSPVILIAGGKDKGLDYVPLRPMLKEKVRACVVFGQIADQLQHAFPPQSPRKSRRCRGLRGEGTLSRPAGRHRPVLSRHFFL